MKSKFMVSLFAGMIAATMLVTGCGGGGGGAASIVGTWTWSQLTIEGITINVANPESSTLTGSTVINPAWITQLFAAQGIPGATLVLTATFNEDKTLTLGGSLSAPGQETEQITPTPGTTWELADDTLTITTDGQSGHAGCSVSGSTLTLTVSSAQVQEAVAAAAAAGGGVVPPEVTAILANMSGTMVFTR